MNLIPICFEHIAANRSPEIFGNDYDTPDGICIRDYVHVSDVAEAHLAVLDTLPQTPGNVVLNVGTGTGTSAQEMVDSIVNVCKRDLETKFRDRRVGDPAAVVGAVDKIYELTGWRARFTVDDIVKSAWISHRHFERISSR